MKNILIVSPSLKNNGGITTVVKNYLNSKINYNFYNLETQIDGKAIKKIVYFVKAFFNIKKIIKKNKIDIVYFHISEGASIKRTELLLKKIKKLNVKTILHHHGANFLTWYESLNNTKKNKVTTMLSSVDTNIVLSEKLKKEYLKIVKINNIEFVYNGVNVTNENKYLLNFNDRKYILFLGRLGERKGIYDLIEALREANIPSMYKLVICGDGEIEKVQSLVNTYHLSEKVIVKGWIDGNQKEEILNNTIINILPSYNEGLPMSILETMSLGIPNISTNIASIPEVIKNNETGILISPGDVNALKKSLEILNDVGLLKKISVNSFNIIKSDFSLEKQIKSTIKIFEK